MTKLSKIWDDITESKDWREPAYRDAYLCMAFMAVALTTYAGVVVINAHNRDTQKPPQQIEQPRKAPSEVAPAFDNPSRK